MKLKKGDKVKIIRGKDNGREGTIDRTYPKSEKVLIQGINMYKKHIKKSEQAPQGGLVDLPRPLQSSKVMVICKNCGKPTRIGYKVDKDRKVRVCKKCQGEI